MLGSCNIVTCCNSQRTMRIVPMAMKVREVQLGKLCIPCASPTEAITEPRMIYCKNDKNLRLLALYLYLYLYISLSLYISISLYLVYSTSISLFLCLSISSLSLSLPLSLSGPPSVYLCIYLSVCLPVCPSVCLSIYPNLSRSIYPSIYSMAISGT